MGHVLSTCVHTVSVPSRCTMGHPWECTIYMYVHCPKCLSHPAVPWDYVGILGNVLTCTIYMYVHCPECLSHPAVPWDYVGIFGNVLTCTIYMYVHCPECLSHPAVPWDYMGILGNVLICTTYMYVHCPECLSHPAVPWDYMGIKKKLNNAKRFQNFGYKKGALKAFEELQISELGKVETETHGNGSVGNNYAFFIHAWMIQSSVMIIQVTLTNVSKAKIKVTWEM